MKNYEINEDTLAVISTSFKKAKIIEKDTEYHVESSGYEVMDYSCQYFGSSYQGRVLGSKNLLKANYKLPVIVEETKNMIFFPTTTPTGEDCCWISLKDVKNYEALGKNTVIYFKNGAQIVVPTSKASIENQILRSSRLACILEERKNVKKAN